MNKTINLVAGLAATGLAALVAGCATTSGTTEVRRLTLSERYACDHQRKVDESVCNDTVRRMERAKCESEYHAGMAGYDAESRAAGARCATDFKFYGDDPRLCLEKDAGKRQGELDKIESAYFACNEGVSRLVADCKSKAEEEYRSCLGEAPAE